MKALMWVVVAMVLAGVVVVGATEPPRVYAPYKLVKIADVSGTNFTCSFERPIGNPDSQICSFFLTVPEAAAGSNALSGAFTVEQPVQRNVDAEWLKQKAREIGSGGSGYWFGKIQSWGHAGLRVLPKEMEPGRKGYELMYDVLMEGGRKTASPQFNMEENLATVAFHLEFDHEPPAHTELWCITLWNDPAGKPKVEDLQPVDLTPPVKPAM